MGVFIIIITKTLKNLSTMIIQGVWSFIGALLA